MKKKLQQHKIPVVHKLYNKDNVPLNLQNILCDADEMTSSDTLTFPTFLLQC